MTHSIYTRDQVTEKSLAELKQIAASIGADKPADARKKLSWVEAILEAQPQKVNEPAYAKKTATSILKEARLSVVDYGNGRYLINKPGDLSIATLVVDYVEAQDIADYQRSVQILPDDSELYRSESLDLEESLKEVFEWVVRYFMPSEQTEGNQALTSIGKRENLIVESTPNPSPNSKITVTEWDTNTVAPVERKYEVSAQAKSWLKQKLIYQGSALGWFLIDLEGNALSNRYQRLIDAVAARYELVNEAKAKKQLVATPKTERTPREIKHLGEGIFKVVGDTGNTYLVEYLNGETQCQCEASRHGRDCYHARAVRAAAESFPNLRNQRLFAELSQVAQNAGYYLLTPDWLSFSAGIASDGARLGEIGCNGAGQWWVRWYAHGNSRKAESAADAMRILMVTRGVVAV